MAAWRALAILAAGLLLPPAALAQGGPPLVTDDPGTPGAGKWEVNYAAILQRTPHRWEVAAPDVDMNYGWGERLQLKLDVPWVLARDSGDPWKSGLGKGDVGVKWRFLDEDQAGYSVSTYPQLGWNILPSSARRGITDAQREFFLPIEVSKEVAEVGYGAEIGRNFVSRGVSQWMAGVIVAPKCGEKCEGLFEVHETYATHEHETLVNIGFRWQVGESMSLLAAAGREFGTSADDQRHVLLYLGLQVLR
jgi:hypothetical protein